MKKLCGIVVFVLGGVVSGLATNCHEKTTTMRQEVNAFIASPAAQQRVQVKDEVFRFLLDTLDKCLVIADKPSRWDRALETFFYCIHSELPLLGGLRSSDPAGMLLVTECDAPRLHSCLQDLCAQLGVPKPMLFLDLNNKVCDAGAEAWGVRHSFIILNKKLIDVVTDQGMRGVLAHELAHIKHNHSLVLSGVMVSVFFGALVLFRYAWCEAAQNVTKLAGATLATMVVLLLVIRFCEEQADRTALNVGEVAQDFAVTMHELIDYEQDALSQYNHEFLLVQEKIKALHTKSPKLATLLALIARVYHKVTSKACSAALDQAGIDHPSLKQREVLAQSASAH